MKLNIELNVEKQDWNESFDDLEVLINNIGEVTLKEISFAKFANDVELSVLLSSDKTVQAINKQYRNIDKPTNVLSFPAEEFIVGKYSTLDDYIMIGDLAFALETLKKEAKEQDKTLSDHFSHLMVHGIMHLLGYDHIEDADAKAMESMEIKILSKLAINNPY